MKHLDKYKKQAIKILNFGIQHNNTIANQYNFSECYVCNELGGLKKIKDDNIYEFVIIVDNDDFNDEDIKKLVKKLPKYYCGYYK